eukprot:jgi/Phyca11/13448/fgenesh1_pg.PHYCAscaffold_3_\
MYVLLSAPLRVGFFFDPWQNAPYHDAWRPELITFTTVDVCGSVLRLWNSRAYLSIGVRLLLKRQFLEARKAPSQLVTKGAFLRTVMGALVRDVYAPGQTLLQPGDTDEMFIVACGEVRLIDSRGTCTGRILAGNAYAEYALFERHLARFRLEAATFCEVWYLPTKSFKAALAKHFSKLVYASLLLQQFAVEARKLRSAAAAIAAAAATPNGDRVFSTSLTQLIVSKVAPWRMPNSRFRQRWALVEWTEGDGTTPRSVQIASFLVSLVVEIFFYSDLILRAFYFVRSVPGEEVKDDTFDMDAPYLRSMLWSIVLVSTVGFGDIVAFSTRECVVDALWIFFGANICYITSCALSSVLAQINVLATIRHDRIEGINVLLMSPSMASVSDATKRTIRSYYEAKWKLNGSAAGDLELLEHLPRSLRRAVSSQLYAPDLRRCALFVEECGLRAASANGDAALFMQQLALMVTCEHFLRNVTVIKEGHLATEFFVVLSGELECLLPPVPLEYNETPAADAAPVPISVLKQHDFFGEESLSDIAKVYEVSIRVVSSARVAMIRRRDFLALAARFPQYVARLRKRKAELRERTRKLVFAHRANFQGESNKKIVRVLGTCTSLYVDSSKSMIEKRGARVLDPTMPFTRWWHRGIGFILVYNFYVIIFRLAFLPYPDAATMSWFTGIDYALDVLLYVDVVLKFGHLGYIEFGEPVLDPESIKKRYRASGRLWQDCLGMLGELLEEVHTEIQERFLRGDAVLLSIFDLAKFFLIFVSTAHYIASLYYLLGWTQLKTNLVDTSWVSVDLILQQNPDSPMVHYMRSMLSDASMR